MARANVGSAPSLAEGMDRRGRPFRSELRTRILSALALGAVALPLLALGGWATAALTASVAGAMGWEFRRVTVGGRMGAALYGGGFAAAALAAGLGNGAVALALLGVLALAFAAADGLRGGSAVWAPLGAATAGLAATAFATLRADADHGLLLALWVVCVTVATDVGAYFAGRRIGGPKLWPSVSPKKTWAGLGGGVALAVVVAAVFSALTMGTHLAPVVMVSGLAAIVAQGGDLAESALKRRFGVKDSSALIPGHGGVLDRLDGFCAVSLVAAGFTLARGAPVYAW